MKFRYNSKMRIIESDDSDIYVKRFVPPREGGERFLLSLGKMKVGFQTAMWWEDVIDEVEPDGTKVWHIGVPVCRIVDGDFQTKKVVEHTNTYKFPDREVQDKVLATFCAAMRVFDGDRKRSAEGLAKARVEFTDEAKQKFQNGDFLWTSARNLS